MTILVIATALALPAGLRVAVNNADAVSDSWQSAADFTVYLKLDVSEEAARRTARAIEERADVAGVTVIDRDAALAEFRAQSGFGEALDALDGNPLPHTLVVHPASGIAGDVEALAKAMAALPETELVQVDTAWVSRLRAMLALAGRLVDFATVLLGLAVAIVVGNTIRLEINNRSVEIEVTKLVGGTDAFIRRPFLYLGLCYGLAGAFVALLVVDARLAVAGPAGPRRGGALRQRLHPDRACPWPKAASCCCGGAFLGWAGAGPGRRPPFARHRAEIAARSRETGPLLAL